MRAEPCDEPDACPGANCSSSTTERPRCDTANAAAEPARPAPTITTSASMASRLSSAFVTTVRDFIDDHRQDLLDDLDAWLRIPGISAQPDHHDDVHRSADWFAEAARKVGFPTVEIWPTADSDAPVVLVYGHHDVQPVDPLALWHTDPFDPTVDGDVLRARGASDDKGQLLFQLLGLRAHLAATGRNTPAVTLKLLIEGEEESGSPNFENLIDERRDRLDADVVVITDTGVIAPDVPSN